MLHTLPPECWEIVIASISKKDDYLRTLYSLLLVNKAFCRFVLPLLYKNPWQFVNDNHDERRIYDGPTTQRTFLWRTLMASFDLSLTLTNLMEVPERLELFDVNGDAKKMESHSDQQNITAHPLHGYVNLKIVEGACRLAKRPPGSINYLAYVENRQISTSLDDLMISLQTFEDPELQQQDGRHAVETFYAMPLKQYQAHAFCTWVEHALLGTHHEVVRTIVRNDRNYWPGPAFWYQNDQSGNPQLILPNLEEISFERVGANSADHLADFIRAHCEQYPHRLHRLSVERSFVGGYDGVMPDLLHAYGGQLRHFANSSPSISANRTDTIRDSIAFPASLISLDLAWSPSDLGELVAQCTNLEKLHIVNPPASVFQLASERAIAGNRNYGHVQWSVYSLKDLRISSNFFASCTTMMLIEATKAYWRTLEIVSASSSPSLFGFQIAFLVWAQPVDPGEKTSAVEPSTTAVPSCTTTGTQATMVEDSIISPYFHVCSRPIPVQVQTPLYHLRKIALEGLCCLQFAPWSLAACPALESLTLNMSGCRSLKSTMFKHHHKALGRVGNWSLCCVPNLQELRIIGCWPIRSRTLVRMLTTRQIQVVHDAGAMPSTTTTTAKNTRPSTTMATSHRTSHGKKAKPTLPRLRHLDLFDCYGFSAKVLQKAIRQLPCLKFVRVTLSSRGMDLIEKLAESVGDEIFLDVDYRHW